MSPNTIYLLSRRWCVIAVVLAAVFARAVGALQVIKPLNPSEPRYPKAAVAANGYECARIGREILEKNGSAVDAAIATLFCNGLSCSQAMGLGGGFLATIYDASTGRVRVLNSRERAPAAATPNMYNNGSSSTVGGLAIAVPGELRGYGLMHREYGRLPFGELVQPTAELALRGHRVTDYMAKTLKMFSDVIMKEPSLREQYVNPSTGKVWNEGDMIKEPLLAQTLDIIAAEGPEAIHDGSLTAALVRDIASFGGIITEDDLRGYRAEWQDPIEVRMTEKHTLYTVPLPGSGSVLAFILNMLKGWAGSAVGAAHSVQRYWQRVVETFKYAYAKRSGLGDLQHTGLSYSIFELERNMSNPEWARQFRARVNDTKTFNDWRHYGAFYEGIDDHGTAHVLVIAQDGSAVSVTSSVNHIWGSKRRSPSLGFILNCQMADFSIPDKTDGIPTSPANRVAPGLQPLSSMVPSIVLDNDGKVALVVGAAGGQKITTQVALAAMDIIVEGQHLVDVVERPRLHHQLMPMVVEYEHTFDPSIIESLKAKGHATISRNAITGFAALVLAGRDKHDFIHPYVDSRRTGSLGSFRSCRWCVISGVIAAVLTSTVVALLVVQFWHPWGVTYPRAGVAANGYECARIGREILENGGSAVDAAIATLFCDGISCAQCMGLGGGFLATIYDASTGRVRVLNARERAPAAATPNMFNGSSSTVGGLAVAVPGELRGYGILHRKYGRLPFSALVRPTAKLARQGHRVTNYMARALKLYSKEIKAEPSLSEKYVNPSTGEVWIEGDMIKEPVLARTLDIIAEEGPEAIHNGSLTTALVRDIASFGGIITEKDLRGYRAEWQKPIKVRMSKEHTLYTVPLPGSGSVLAFILNMLNGWAGSAVGAAHSVQLYWQRVVETFKYAYAKRSGLGDVEHTGLNYSIAELVRNMTNPHWARQFRARVDDTKTFNDWRHYEAFYEGIEDHGTANIVVLAPDGSAVCITSTVNLIWGCKRRSRSLGFILNNEMVDFSIPNKKSYTFFPASPANSVAPGLQPLSSMVPSIVLDNDGKVALVVGAAGGAMITTQVALVTKNIIIDGHDLEDVMERPRLHHQLLPMEVQYEQEFNPSIIESLKAKGHATKPRNSAGFAAVVLAGRDEYDFIYPYADSRRIGSVAGF